VAHTSPSPNNSPSEHTVVAEKVSLQRGQLSRDPEGPTRRGGHTDMWNILGKETSLRAAQALAQVGLRTSSAL
jgi:hypothetical protein